MDYFEEPLTDNSMKKLITKIQTDKSFRDCYCTVSKSYEKIPTKTISDKFLEATKDLLPVESCSGLKVAVLGFASSLVGLWDPFDTDRGLPGSEECAIYATQELAARGHKVTVYMNPPEDSIWRSNFSNPKWIPENLWNSPENIEKYDLVLMWRRTDLSTGKKRGKIVVFWPHDSFYNIPKETKFPSFDGVFLLSNHHRNQLNRIEGFCTIPYTISGNGIVPSQFDDPSKSTNPLSIGYFSNYSRGLEILIGIWPIIKKLFPKATLSICYGRQTWNLMTPQKLSKLVKKIEDYESLGVTEHGKIGHLELAEIMKNTSIWAYPCTDAGETFCITAVKCQAAGCIPVTSRIGALNETVDYEASTIPLIENILDAFDYQQLLIKTLERVQISKEEDLSEERKKYITFSKKFSWANCIDKWLELYHRLSEESV